MPPETWKPSDASVGAVRETKRHKSTSQDVLEAMSSQHPLPGLIGAPKGGGGVFRLRSLCRLERWLPVLPGCSSGLAPSPVLILRPGRCVGWGGGVCPATHRKLSKVLSTYTTSLGDHVVFDCDRTAVIRTRSAKQQQQARACVLGTPWCCCVGCHRFFVCPSLLMLAASTSVAQGQGA